MKRILIKSVHDAFDYVMSHYYPPELEEFSENTDTYSVISIQDTHIDGFGFEFKENKYCKEVLTLYFDDVARPVDGAIEFTDKMAREIIEFVKRNLTSDTLLIHCYGGQSRSKAVGAFILKMLGKDNSAYFTKGSPNMLVYDTLIEELKKMAK